MSMRLEWYWSVFVLMHVVLCLERLWVSGCSFAAFKMNKGAQSLWGFLLIFEDLLMLSLVSVDIRGFWGSEHGMVFVLQKKKIAGFWQLIAFWDSKASLHYSPSPWWANHGDQKILSLIYVCYYIFLACFLVLQMFSSSFDMQLLDKEREHTC